MNPVPVEAGTCNRETLQSLILELKALQKSNCGITCVKTQHCRKAR